MLFIVNKLPSNINPHNCPIYLEQTKLLALNSATTIVEFGRVSIH